MQWHSTVPSLPVKDGVIFKHIPDWYGYCASSDGHIWSCKLNHKGRFGEWRKLSPADARTKGGYWNVKLCKDGRVVPKSVHSLILETFVCSRPDGMQVCHIDGNPKNNRVENLRWGTPRENNLDKIKHGTIATGDRNGSRCKSWTLLRGSGHHKAKLTDEQVIQIRAEYANGFRGKAYSPGVSHNSIAKKYGVTAAAIRAIVNRKNWSHI